MPKPRKPQTRINEPQATYDVSNSSPAAASPQTPAAVPQTRESYEQRLARLRQHAFKPGVSGNPRGRPRKGEGLNDILKKRLDKDAAAVVDRLFDAALKEKRLDALIEILNRGLGKPAVTVERSEDERHLAWAELQTKLLERWNVRLQGSSDIPQLTQGEIPSEDPQS